MFLIIQQLVNGVIGGLATPLFSWLNKRSDNDTARYSTAAAVEQGEMVAKTQVVVAEQQKWYTAMVRPLFAFPFIIYDAKLVIWDKVLALGTTDPLSSDLLKIEMIIIGAYFIGISADKFAAIRKA